MCHSAGQPRQRGDTTGRRGAHPISRGDEICLFFTWGISSFDKHAAESRPSARHAKLYTTGGAKMNRGSTGVQDVHSLLKPRVHCTKGSGTFLQRHRSKSGNLSDTQGIWPVTR